MQRPSLSYEMTLWARGYTRIAGIDEAGRGAWAGPVVASAVVLPEEQGVVERLAGVADSKLLSALQRERLLPLILAVAQDVGLGIVPAGKVDAIGIVAATREAMARALAALQWPPDFLLIDYMRLPAVLTPQQALVGGDSQVLSIAAASIVAKVSRDRMMVEIAGKHPGYGFERHKGYGTPEHAAALNLLGPCHEHRLSFQPVRGMQMSLFPGQGDNW